MKEEHGWEELERDMSDEMKKMAGAYHSAKVPDELKGKVLESIARGRAEAGEEAPSSEHQIYRLGSGTGSDEGHNRRKTAKGENRMNRILLRTGQTAAAALLAMTVLANSGAEIAYAMEQIPVVGAITKVVTFRTYEKQEGKSEAKVEVPKVEAESGSGMDQAATEINRSVEEYTDRLIAQFEEEVKAEGGEANHALYSNYEVVTDNDRLFTLRINVDEIMASSAGSVKIYNVDKKTDQILSLKDLFPAGTDYVTLLSDAVKKRMRADMAGDENKIYFVDDELAENFQTIKEDQNFYINDAGHLVLVFDEYEVAPGYMGVVEIEIPGDVFQYQQ